MSLVIGLTLIISSLFLILSPFILLLMTVWVHTEWIGNLTRYLPILVVLIFCKTCNYFILPKSNFVHHPLFLWFAIFIKLSWSSEVLGFLCWCFKRNCNITLKDWNNNVFENICTAVDGRSSKKFDCHSNWYYSFFSFLWYF